MGKNFKREPEMKKRGERETWTDTAIVVAVALALSLSACSPVETKVGSREE